MKADNLTIQAPEHAYPVAIRRDGREELISFLRHSAKSRRALLVTDENVAELHGLAIAEKLNARGVKTQSLVMKPGESHKTLATVESLYESALDAGVDRETLIVGVGGGVVGDVAGYLAATLLRGLPVVHVPTTVIAQVDSSIGGKTGVNLKRGKNLVGAFHSPIGVFIDIGFLKTLPADERRAGLAEAVKHGAIAAPDLLDFVEQHFKGLNAGHLDDFYEVVTRAVRVKAQVVSDDYLEQGRRAILNFGHTLGHAFEAQHGYGDLRHGEAVALGMAFAAELSQSQSGLPQGSAEQLTQTLESLELATDWASHMNEGVLDYLAHDKKSRGDMINFILLKNLGEPVITPVPVRDLYAVANSMAAQDVGVNSL